MGEIGIEHNLGTILILPQEYEWSGVQVDHPDMANSITQPDHHQLNSEGCYYCHYILVYT